MMGYPSIVRRRMVAVKREMKRAECLNMQAGFQFRNTAPDPRTPRNAPAERTAQPHTTENR